jgi:Na+/proline symporter
MSPILIGILAYVAVQLLIAILVSRRIRNENDYLLAGRRFGLGLATFMIFATWFGAETCIGAAGAVYQGGLSNSVADPFAYTICLLLMGFFFAIPLWRRKLTTFADLFRQRFSPNVEKVAVLMLVPTSIMWAAAQIRALGQVISSASQFDVELAIAIAAGVVIVYTVYGGLLADAVTDLFQGIMVMVGLVILLVVVVQTAGGLQPALAAIDPARLQLFGNPNLSALATLEKWAIPITGSVVAQELVAVILASHTPQTAQRASLLGASLYLVFGLIPVFIGLVGLTLMPGLTDPEQLLPLIAQKYLSTLPYIIFVGAIISAILSTVASSLLAAAALTSHNLIVPLNPGLSEHARVRVARVGVVVAGIAAYLLARHAEGIYALVEQSSAFGGAGIFVIVMFGLFSSFGGPRAALASLSVGAITWLTAEQALHLPAPYLLSLAASLLAYSSVAVLEQRVAKRIGSQH